jgi:ubiquitin carboxyl-terminal hydrolase MINDY-3/4
MFGEEEAIQESSSDALLEKVRRTFKGMEGGAEENGFIQTGQLGTFFNAVGLERLTEHEVQMLCATMEAYGAGIILWEELWKKTSRLLTGASVQSVLQDSGNSGTSTPPPPLSESDPISKNSSFDAAAAATSDAPMTDEELARLLQAELNGGVVDLTAIGGSDGVAASCTNATTSDTASTTAVAAPEFPEALVSGTQYGHTFEMYHYNGLRGGKLRQFRVTRLNADEAIGASVPLGASQHHHTMASMGGDLEDVLRTKWYVVFGPLNCT